MRHPFLRTLAGSAAPAATDPNFENVTLLLHGDGTNGGQNNTFVDGSTNNFTITRNGNTTQGTFSPYGDNWSVAVNGSSAYLTSANNANLAIGNSDFTFECWANGNSFSTDWSTFFGRWQTGGNYGYFFAYDTDGGLTFIYSTTGSAGGNVGRVYGGTMTVGRWHHVAFCRSAGTTRAFLDGVQIGSATSDNVTIYNNNGPQTIGGVIDGVTIFHPFNGYVSNLRLVIGTALYTSNFTPSSTPLTAVTNTKLLACASNRFVDKSTTGLTLTSTGSPSVRRFSPFSPTAAYATGTIGGGGYFDGSGDYLGVPSGAFSYASGTAYTFEVWVYLTSYPTQYPQIFGPAVSAGSNTASMYIENNGAVGFGQANVGVFYTAAAGTIGLNRWNHIAVGKNSSNSGRMWVNGVSVATATDTANYAVGATIVGQNPAGTQRVAGYICDLRSVTGSDVYGSANTTITVPTAPLSSVTNTQLRLAFQNAAILDNAMMAVPETVGNAQIDTTIKKFGTGSLEFDGTGDWLLVPDSIDQRLGTGNFTIECWLYLSATGAARGIVGKGTSTTGWLLSTNSSNAVVFVYGTSTITSTGTLSATTWYHIAVVREGTGTNQTKIYIGGTNDGTGTVSTDFTQTNAAYVGANRTGGDALNGYIDDLRITKGVARYTANFTPPTAAFPDL